MESIDQDIEAIEHQTTAKKQVFVPKQPAEIHHLAQFLINC